MPFAMARAQFLAKISNFVYDFHAPADNVVGVLSAAQRAADRVSLSGSTP